jgi:DNA recombination protein RmuC
MKRQSAQQNPVYYAEHGGIGANSNGQNKNDNRGVPGIAAQGPHSITEVHNPYTDATDPGSQKVNLCQTKVVIALATFVAGIVFGAVLTALFFKNRQAPPIVATLERLEAQIRDLESQRQHMQGGLNQQLTSLSRETVALSQALRAPNTRGRWGELTLRRVAELSGMASQCDFFEQHSSDGQRPDMIVKLPGGRTLAVDAKVPLSAYLDAEAAVDDPARRAALDRHAQQVMRHVMQLGGREYWARLQPSPEMVVLFMAGDHFLAAALERDPELLEKALARKVLLATPVTLVSVLKGVAYTWRQEKLAQNAGELRKLGAELYDRVRVFADSYSDAGRNLAKAVDAYNRSAASWEMRLSPSLKRMRELGVGGNDDAPQPPRLEAVVRETQGADRPT